jgi:hypothetical protein
MVLLLKLFLNFNSILPMFLIKSPREHIDLFFHGINLLLQNCLLEVSFNLSGSLLWGLSFWVFNSFGLRC